MRVWWGDINILMSLALSTVSSIATSSRTYPPLLFTHHHNVRYYYYPSFIAQGNMENNYGVHPVKVVNLTGQNLEIVDFQVLDGRVLEGFTGKVIRPSLFDFARVVPWSWEQHVVGAVVVKVQGTNTFYTLGFKDQHSRKWASLIEGNDVKRAIAELKEGQEVSSAFGREYVDYTYGRGRSTFEILR